ncbi:alpha/beta fold hydrolase [Nonomuraea sp. CA-141351]|uniref:alpha/beta fold hydrolase n=1 Tax=Nonomuraea sp. CA-141351 TaxID=3239996 RepID=UPI003D8CCB06
MFVAEHLHGARLDAVDRLVSRTSPTRAPQVELRRIATNGIHANVATAGTGPAVVLLHGFPHTWQLWSEIIGPLSAQYRVIAPDLRGFASPAQTEQLAPPFSPSCCGRWPAGTGSHGVLR